MFGRERVRWAISAARLLPLSTRHGYNAKKECINQRNALINARISHRIRSFIKISLNIFAAYMQLCADMHFSPNRHTTLYRVVTN